jgi:hypothetical protein
MMHTGHGMRCSASLAYQQAVITCMQRNLCHEGGQHVFQLHGSAVTSPFSLTRSRTCSAATSPLSLSTSC